MRTERAARVVVAKNTRSVDKTYDYLIPEPMAGQVSVGMRVIVPFGARNSLVEGYVVSLCVPDGSYKLKPIKSVPDGQPLFDEKAWELAEWMRGRYLCTYLDALRVMIPTGIEIKFEDWVCLLPSDGDEKVSARARSQTRRKIVELLEDEGGQIELHRLMSMFETNIRATIRAMEQDGSLRMEQRDSARVGDKTVRFASLTVSGEEALKQAEALKKSAPKQAAMLEILAYNECVAVADLVYLAQTTHNAVQALCKKELVTFEDRVVRRSPQTGQSKRDARAHKLTEQQTQVLGELTQALESKQTETFLLHGVTGAGKTEVYMRLIAKALEMGRTAVVLVPEISLTPQMTQRFSARFGKRIAILHSALSLGERYDEWKRIKSGEVDVVVGARSAVFAPLRDIGVIILDEEHESSYKSETAPRYHAREVAAKRCEQHGALLLLASATPLVESYYHAARKDYRLLTLKSRYNNAPMPRVNVVDMREELRNGNRTMFSRALREELQKNLDAGQQSILFLNRRGFSTFVSCRECGFVAKCPHCNISLTYHRFTDRLTCHTCGYNCDNYRVCPQCGSKYIKYFGAGTQKLEEELKREFDGISVIRMDVDTTGRKNSHEKLLQRFDQEKVDVLIGTQMVAKGLDFPNVTLVGVVAADASLYIDDYRSAERTFNLITQVAGRAGRGAVEGRAVVQTYTPENSAVRFAASHDYEGFYREEIEMRRAMWYPPFSELISIVASGLNETMVVRRMKEVGRLLHLRCDDGSYGKVYILGPAAAGISKIKDRYRWHILIKCECASRLNDVLREIIDEHTASENSKWVSLTIDKNPASLA